MIASSTLRISLSLVVLTIFVVFVANWLGFIPDEKAVQARSRVAFAEAIGVQFSVTLQQNNLASIPATIKSIVERNAEIRSINFRQSDGTVIGSYGDLPVNTPKQSTIDFMIAPIFKDNQEWGAVEIAFSSSKSSPWWNIIDSTFYQLVLFITLTGFVLYFMLIKKVLKHLDPNRVIPERVKKALNALTEGVVLIDAGGHIVLSNRSFEQRIARPSNKLLGSLLTELPWSYPARSDKTTTLPWNDTLAQGKPVNNVTLNYNLSEDQNITHIVNSTPLQDESGKVRGALVSFSDVTALEKMNKDLESMAQFLRHEMRNALAGANSTVTLLEQSTHLSEADKALLDRAHQSHRVIAHLLESVNQANTIEASFSKEQTHAIRLDQLVAETVRMYADMYNDNAIVFESDGAPLLVLAQDERIIQMLDKLMTNAIDHGEQGTAIQFKCQKQQNRAVITVINQGAPLPANTPALFDLFASFSQDASSNQNQGIGLYVVKMIAETYGGKVYAKDHKAAGSVEFVIELPLIPA